MKVSIIGGRFAGGRTSTVPTASGRNDVQKMLAAWKGGIMIKNRLSLAIDIFMQVPCASADDEIDNDW